MQVNRLWQLPVQSIMILAFSTSLMNELLQRTEYRVYASLAALACINTLLFIAPQTTSLTLITTPFSNQFFYIGFYLCAAATLGAIISFSKKFAWQILLFHLLAIWLPATIVLVYGLSESQHFHYIFRIAAGVYVMLVGLLTSATFIARHPLQPAVDALSVSAWLRAQGKVTLLLVGLCTLIFFGSGLYRLTQYAAVDEPLWIDGRIHRFWKNIGERDWKGTNISDKPGITVALATGIGTLFKSASEFKTSHFQGEVFNLRVGVEDYYFTFRFPLLLTITLFLPLFYFLLERLLGYGPALLGYAFLTTSPLLIGMSKIINPDSLLWIFTPLSLLAYLVFRKRHAYRYLILSGILFGLALLTKYIANILFIFWFGLIFLEYLVDDSHRASSLALYLKRSFQSLAILTFFALMTFYALFPAVWIKPEKLLRGTLFSQAFEKVAPLFLLFIVLILVDQWLNGARITTLCLHWLKRHQLWLYRIFSFAVSAFIIVVLCNVWLGMPLYSFPELLAAPKTIATKSDFFGIFLTNFYPLLFGLPPITLLLLCIAPWWLMRRQSISSPSAPILFYILIFIFLYYLGATVNGVASIIRYQIILFPLVALLAGIILHELLGTIARWGTHFSARDRTFLAAGIIAAFGLWTIVTTPYPLSYASSLLPLAYHVDVKDMGAGSYEAAAWLNTLPDAKDKLVWTDKDGVCKFFVGRCKRGLDYAKLRADGLDYIIVSAGRESRTTKMMGGDVEAQKPGLIRFDQYYHRTDPEHEILINDRPSHFVKIFSFSEATDSR